MRAALVAAAILGSLLTACGLSTNDGPQPISKEHVPPDLQDGVETATTLPEGVDNQVVSVWLLQTGDAGTVLSPVDRTVPWPANATRVLDALFDQGPTEEERNAGFSTAIPDARFSSQPELIDNVLHLGLSASTYDALSGTNGSNAFAQIVFTVTQLEGIDYVQFLLDGEPIRVPDGLGESTKEPVGRRDYDNLLPS